MCPHAVTMRPSRQPIRRPPQARHKPAAYVYLVSVGEPVTVGGLSVQPGDLLHGDQHGVLSIPFPNADASPPRRVASKPKNKSSSSSAVPQTSLLTPCWRAPNGWLPAPTKTSGATDVGRGAWPLRALRLTHREPRDPRSRNLKTSGTLSNGRVRDRRIVVDRLVVGRAARVVLDRCRWCRPCASPCVPGEAAATTSRARAHKCRTGRL